MKHLLWEQSFQHSIVWAVGKSLKQRGKTNKGLTFGHFLDIGFSYKSCKEVNLYDGVLPKEVMIGQLECNPFDVFAYPTRCAGTTVFGKIVQLEKAI